MATKRFSYIGRESQRISSVEHDVMIKFQMTNSWRALARMARDRIVTSDPSDLTLILGVRPFFPTFFLVSLEIIKSHFECAALAYPAFVPSQTTPVQPNLRGMHQPLHRPQRHRTLGIARLRHGPHLTLRVGSHADPTEILGGGPYGLFGRVEWVVEEV